MKLLFAGDYVQSIDIDNALFSPEVERRIAECDYRCCNFEGPCETSKMVPINKIGPNIHQKRQAVERIKNAGFNIVSLANNHIMDFGSDGLKQTLQEMETNGISSMGAGLSSEEVYRPLILKDHELTLGILFLAENGFGALTRKHGCGYAWFGDERAKQAIKECLCKCDRTIIVCHGGAEKWDYPLPEYRELYRAWIDQGVTAVIGHHPHVPQGWEKYGSGYIFYSLGNFIFNKGLGFQDPETILCTLSITKESVKAETINVKCVDGVIEINEDKTFIAHINNCNSILQSKDYLDIAEKKCLEVFERSYKGYFSAVNNYYSKSIKGFLKTLYFRVLKRQRFSDLWLFHNLSIETHYWISRRAEQMKYYTKSL